jgi:hypothetical protein
VSEAQASEAQASEVELVSVATHPRSAASVRRAKSWGGLAGFGAVAAGGWLSDAELGNLLLKALAGGIVAYLLVWALAVAVWQGVLRAEAKRSVDEAKRAAQQRARALAERAREATET